MPLEPGTVLDGRYTIQRRLGGGGFGVVHLATARSLGIPCAVKTLREELGGHDAPAEALRREAKAAVEVRSAHVAQWRDFGTTEEGAPYVVFEYCEGETLADRLKRGPMAPGEAVAVLEQLADGVTAIHRAGILHRDLKPSNVMLLPEPDGPPFVKILDFGLARVIDAGLSLGVLTTMGACTPAYAPPEYHRPDARAAALGPPFDVFSLGVIAYEMLAGQRPFTGSTPVEVARRVLECRPTPLDAVVPELRQAPGIPAAVHAALAPDPRRRPTDLAAWSGRLEEALAQWRQGLAPTVPGEREAPPSRRRRLLLAAALAVVVAGGAVWAFLGADGDTDPGAPPPVVHDARSGIDLLLVRGGETVIGCDDAPYPDEGPARRVVLSAPFYLGRTEVTRAQWARVMGGSAPGEDEAGLPMTHVSCEEVQEFLDRTGLRLPTEAEWEHAARAGRTGRADPDVLRREARMRGGGAAEPHPGAAGGLEPNPWGFHDMAGNVWEWCAGGYDATFYEKLRDGAVDPRGPADAAKRVQKGGSVFDEPERVGWTSRAGGLPETRQRSVGFRVARDA